MKPSTVTVFQLFESQRRFVIPLFQRPYVWSLDRQWKPLWDDISAKADQVLAYEQQPHHPLRKHFMGAVVLNQIRTFGRQVAASEVIDGQQRLTTLQILLVALRDYLTAAEQQHPLKLLAKITDNDLANAQNNEKYKV